MPKGDGTGPRGKGFGTGKVVDQKKMIEYILKCRKRAHMKV